MPIHFTNHYNISRERKPLTQEERLQYQRMVEWIRENKQARNTISFNNLFLETLLWEDETILKSISKLCLTKRNEICASSYSSFIPFFKDFEDQIIEKQLQRSYKQLKKTYPNSYIKGFYDSFGCWDNRFKPVLTNNNCEYVYVDWKVIADTLQINTTTIPSSILRPYKLENEQISVFPSISLSTIFRLFPDVLRDTINTGDFSYIYKKIEKIIGETSDFDNYLSLIIDLNPIQYSPAIESIKWSNFFHTASMQYNPQFDNILPSLLIKENGDSFETIDLQSGYSLEIAHMMKQSSSNYINLNCQYFTTLFGNYLTKILYFQEKNRKNGKIKDSSIEQFIMYCWNVMLKCYQNVGFANCGTIQYRDINIENIINTWNNITYLDLIFKLLQGLLSPNTIEHAPFVELVEKGSNIIYWGKEYFAKFSHRGGKIMDLFHPKTGEILCSSPISEKCVSDTPEPRYGIMYDIVSKKYQGQFNLFNEWYTLKIEHHQDFDKFTFINYIYRGLKLYKSYIFNNNQNSIDIVYSIENDGKDIEDVDIYSLSIFNTGTEVSPQITKQDIWYDFDASNKDMTNFSIINKQLNQKVYIEIPSSVRWEVTKRFKDLRLNFHIDIPNLKSKETVSYKFKLTNGKNGVKEGKEKEL